MLRATKISFFYCSMFIAGWLGLLFSQSVLLVMEAKGKKIWQRKHYLFLFKTFFIFLFYIAV